MIDIHKIEIGQKWNYKSSLGQNTLYWIKSIFNAADNIYVAVCIQTDTKNIVVVGKEYPILLEGDFWSLIQDKPPATFGAICLKCNERNEYMNDINYICYKCRSNS